MIALVKQFTAMMLAALSCSALACPVEYESIRVTINGHGLNAEVATEMAAHHCGLAFREELPADRGMLFVYPEDQVLRFWMKDTRIDLSIAFLDKEGVILEMHDMDSENPTRQFISRQPARYALEVNQGWFVLKGIKTGDRVEMVLPTVLNIR